MGDFILSIFVVALLYKMPGWAIEGTPKLILSIILTILMSIAAKMLNKAFKDLFTRRY